MEGFRYEPASDQKIIYLVKVACCIEESNDVAEQDWSDSWIVKIDVPVYSCCFN